MGSPRLLLLASVASAGRVYHLTDIHVDPIYVVNSSTAAYCNGPVIKNASLQAPIFGAPVGDCATPEALYDSALAFMADQPAADMVLFTGDFTQAGLQREAGADSVLDTIAATHEKLRAALPGVKVYGAVGNHDSLTYQRLMQRYAATVKGQFYGHDHEDYVRLTRECDDATCTGSATGVVFVGPSLTEGWPSENPAVRVYVTDGNYTVEDALTYTADILEANEKGAATWVLEYSAKDRLRLDDLSPRSWEKYVALQLATNESAFDDHVALRRRGYRGPRNFFNDADYAFCVKN
ncbi:hypothetical protein JL721_2567 [Aureococcus anophagefferens]|nr:hypothetical protein JL721_2567 [Aureococcus anophagefferens]